MIDKNGPKLSHVLWLGGASDSGKTTIAQILGQKNRWQLYLCDMHEHNHLIARSQPDLHPVTYNNLSKSIDEKWIFTTPEEMFQDIMSTNNERFPMICYDLNVMPSKPIILVEGPRLFPNLVQPMLSDIHQAIWLLPTDEFAENSASQRDKPKMRYESCNADLFKSNFFERERLLRNYIRKEVFSLKLPYIEITGIESVDIIANKVELHYKEYIGNKQDKN